MGRYGNPNEEHVFPSEGGEALTFHGVEMLFKRLRARVGIMDKRVSAHIFRHTFAVCYLMLGGDIFSLQELVGHEDISTVKHYMHLNDVNVQTQKRKYSPETVCRLLISKVAIQSVLVFVRPSSVRAVEERKRRSIS